MMLRRRMFPPQIGRTYAAALDPSLTHHLGELPQAQGEATANARQRRAHDLAYQAVHEGEGAPVCPPPQELFAAQYVALAKSDYHIALTGGGVTLKPDAAEGHLLSEVDFQTQSDLDTAMVYGSLADMLRALNSLQLLNPPPRGSQRLPTSVKVNLSVFGMCMFCVSWCGSLVLLLETLLSELDWGFKPVMFDTGHAWRGGWRGACHPGGQGS